jgi:hypothetical protein
MSLKRLPGTPIASLNARDESPNGFINSSSSTSAALAHVAGDETERAYRRGDALEKRRALMEAWAAYCEPIPESNVIALKR